MNLDLYKNNSIRFKCGFLDLLSGGLLGSIGSIVGSGITAGANVAAVNATNKANIMINRENNQFNHDENTLAYNRQRQLINEQNDYNSFANQRSLMEQAGYNPNNLVGGTAGTAVSSSSTNVGAASAAPSHGMIAPDLSALGNIANIGLTTAQTALLNAQAKKVDSETAGQDLQNSYQDMQNALYKLYGEKQIVAGLNLQDAQAALFDNQRYVQKTIAALNEYDLQSMRPAQLGYVTAQSATELLKQTLIKAQEAKTDAERTSILRTLPAQLALLSAQTFAATQQGRYNSNQADLISGPQKIGSSFFGLIPKYSNGGPLYQHYTLENNNLRQQYRGLGFDNMLKAQQYDYLDEYNSAFLENMRYELRQAATWDKRKYGRALFDSEGHIIDDVLNGAANCFFQILDVINPSDLFDAIKPSKFSK